MDKQVYGNFKKRVIREAILKSVIAGVSLGCACAFLTEILSWLFGFKPGLYIALGVLIAVSLTATLLFYYKKYKPTAKEIAGRIDGIGLEERMLTMLELEGDDSYIASAQRQDTMKALASANHMLIRFVLTTALIVCVCVSVAFFAGMTVVNGLYVGGVIPSGMDIMRGDGSGGQSTKFSVKYNSTEGGRVVFYTEGWANLQDCNGTISVNSGEDAPMVIALPDAGFTFAGWSDNNSFTRYRQDMSVEGDIEATARFEKLNGREIGEGVFSPDGLNMYLPTANQEGDNFEPDDERIESDDESDGGGKDESDREMTSNKTDNGENYYGDTYESDYSSAKDEERDQESQDIVDGYYQGIRPPVDDDEDPQEGLPGGN